MYHRIAYPDADPWSLCVSPKYFSEQLEVLRRVGYPYTIGNLVRDYSSGNLRKNAFVVAFDDGYLDNLAVAKPLLEAHDIPATMFICSGAVGRKEEFWWDQLTRAFLCPTKERPKQLVLDAAGKCLSWDFATAESTQKGWGSSNTEPTQTTAISNYIAVWKALRPLPPAALEQCMRQIREWAAIPNEARPTHRTLNSDQLVALASNGLIDIGAHTVSHPLLPAHPYELQRQEILDSKAQLEDVIQRPIEHFAYPYGGYDQRTLRILHEIGFVSACTSSYTKVDGTVTIPMKRYELPRMQVENWSGEKFLEIVQEKLSDGKSELMTRVQQQVELSRRSEFLRLLPTGSIGAELGVFKGEFSRHIIQVVRPKELHLIDAWWRLYEEFYPDWGEYTDYGRLRTKDAFELAKRNVESCRSTERIVFHVGDDVEYLNSLPDHYFDWIYIDSSHEFDHTMAELEVAALKVKPTGFIMGHDWHDDPSCEHFGVRKAIEEFILQGPYRLDHLDRASTQWCLRRKSKSNLAKLSAWHRIGALTRADHRSLPQSSYQMPAFMVVKNETTRLPLTLQYHRSLGVDGFFAIDNNSTDGTLEFLLSQPDTHVYTTGESYREARVGIDWIEQLLTVHGNNRWCLIIDADEHLIYQGCESLPLPKLCKELDSRRVNCLPTMFLDMYSHLPILQTQLTNSAATLLDCCPYFDATGYYKHEVPGIPSISGGVRARLFWPEVDLSFAGLSTLMRLAFDEHAYLDMYPDVYTAVQNGAIESGLEHFTTFGRFEGRAIKVRDLDWLERHYRDQNPDVDQAVLRGDFVSGLEHFVRFGWFEGRCFWSCQLPLLTQVPLLRWNPQLKIHVGRHDLFGAEWHPSGAVGGILLHFRLMSDLPDRAHVVMKDADSPASPAWSEQNERYCKVLREQPNLSAFCENSIRYVDSNQLVKIGLMSALAELGDDHPVP